MLALRVALQADDVLGALPGGVVAGIINAIFIMIMNHSEPVPLHVAPLPFGAWFAFPPSSFRCLCSRALSVFFLSSLSFVAW